MPDMLSQMSPQSQHTLIVPRGAVFPGFEGIGERDDANGANIDVTHLPTNIQPEPVTGGFQPNIISSSASDASGGDGVDEVTVHYLNTAGVQAFEVLAVTGQTQNFMTATDVMFVQETHSSSIVGTGIVAAGNIDVRNGVAVVNRIEATGNQSLSTMRQVPAGHNFILEGWHGFAVAAAGGKIARIRIRSSWHRNQGENQPGIYHFIDPVGAKDNGTGWLVFPKPILIGPLATIKISVWTTGVMDISGAYRGYLEPIITGNLA
jgi:hypothetical protein